jgi:fatty acid desaturase
MVWNLYGKKYNLQDYIIFHPGGETILKNTENETDITALFETYHAFSRKKYYKTVLDKYEVVDICSEPNLDFDFDFTNYNKLLERVKTRFPNRESIKAPFDWYFQNGIVLMLYVYTFYYGFFSTTITTNKYIFSQIAGLCYISLGFNIFHDASHYAVSISPNINRFLSKIWASWGLWNIDLWFYHHILNHHSYTGLEKKDPDLYHLRPFVNKTVGGKAQLLNNNTDLLPFITIIFPGYYVGQMIAYFAAPFQRKLFHAKIPNKQYYDIIDFCLILSKLYCFYYGGIWATINYILALNFWYHINIAIDHDTYETIIENHYSGKDWLKIQICNSANFLNQSWVWTRFFGGINYQIEHHLFPNMSNVHYPTIAPIVQDFCNQNGIRYVHYNNLWEAYLSYLKMLRVRNYG